MIKKLPKTPKLAKNLLVTLARFLNVPIELKGINYYPKVFKIVSFKLIRVSQLVYLDFGPLMGVINKIYNLYHHALG